MPSSCNACRGAIPERPVVSGAATARAVPASLVAGRVQAFAEILRYKGMNVPTWYALSPTAKLWLRPLFGRWGLDLGSLSFSTGGAFGNAGITFGKTIWLSRDFGTGSTASFARQIVLLAHEITHSVQYQRIGFASFLPRYVREWYASGKDPYGVPEALARIPLDALDPVDPRFYLDQLCDRVAAEINVE